MTGQEYPGRRRTESAAFGWERRRFGAGEDSPGAWAETPPADPAGRKRGERAPFGALNVGGTTKCENLHALVPLICGGTGACCCFLGGGAPLPPSPGGGIFGIGQCRGFFVGRDPPPGAGPVFGSPCRGFVSPLRRRAPFWSAKKGRKSRLEPAVLRTPFCPDVYWESCSSCGAISSERRWTLRLPPSPRFQRAGLVGRRVFSLSAEIQPDGAGLASGRAACCRFPAHQRNLEHTTRAERSGRTSHPQLSLEAGTAI